MRRLIILLLAGGLVVAAAAGALAVLAFSKMGAFDRPPASRGQPG